jgi:hypothetical protein
MLHSWMGSNRQKQRKTFFKHQVVITPMELVTLWTSKFGEMSCLQQLKSIVYKNVLGKQSFKGNGQFENLSREY